MPISLAAKNYRFECAALSVRNRRSRAQLQGLSSNFADILGADALARISALARLRRAWLDIVGAMMARRTEPLQLETLDAAGTALHAGTEASHGDGGLCLWVAVDHAMMGQQIRFLRDDIRKACFRHAQIDNLYQVRTRLLPGAGVRSQPPKREPRTIPFAIKRRLALDLASIKDRRLRSAAFNARVAQMAYQDEENE